MSSCSIYCRFDLRIQLSARAICCNDIIYHISTRCVCVCLKKKKEFFLHERESYVHPSAIEYSNPKWLSSTVLEPQKDPIPVKPVPDGAQSPPVLGDIWQHSHPKEQSLATHCDPMGSPGLSAHASEVPKAPIVVRNPVALLAIRVIEMVWQLTCSHIRAKTTE